MCCCPALVLLVRGTTRSYTKVCAREILVEGLLSSSAIAPATFYAQVQSDFPCFPANFVKNVYSTASAPLVAQTFSASDCMMSVGMCCHPIMRDGECLFCVVVTAKHTHVHPGHMSAATWNCCRHFSPASASYPYITHHCILRTTIYQGVLAHS
jgi:hypothetical protein